MKEWEKFKVGNPAKKGFNKNCMAFGTISHTCHVDSAINIIKAGKISPTLVFDESKLNNERILVSWLSPNHWGNGYRYGNIKFEFPFKDLIKDKSFYWVEVGEYKIKAPRILITDINHNSQLETYSPFENTGPWWFDKDNNKHYYNGNYCLEFMVEDSILLEKIEDIEFVDHHKSYCSINRYYPENCNELGLRDSIGGALFLTRAIVTNVNISVLYNYFIREDGRLTTNFEFALDEYLTMVTRNVNFSGSLTEYSDNSYAVARAAMSAFTFGLKSEAKYFSAMFKDDDSFLNASAKLLADFIGHDNWKKLLSINS